MTKVTDKVLRPMGPNFKHNVLVRYTGMFASNMRKDTN